MESRILQVLCAHMSQLNARALLTRLEAQTSGTVGRAPTADELVDSLLENGALFCEDGAARDLRAKLLALRSGPRRPGAIRIEVKNESDVSRARLAARDLCEALGARRLATQQVATVVSELARNIVLYTPGGTILLEPLDGVPARMRIVAEDRGPGIPNLKSVLDGSYRSQTGLGKGLLGVKRLMDRFDVKTGPKGTRIEAEGALGFQGAGT